MAPPGCHESDRSLSGIEQWMRRRTRLKRKPLNRPPRLRMAPRMRPRSLSGTAGSQPPVEEFERLPERRSLQDWALPDHPSARSGRVRTGLSCSRRRPRPPGRHQGAEPGTNHPPRGCRSVSRRSPNPRQAGPSPHRAGLRCGSHGRRTLLRRVEAHRRQRPGGQDGTGSTVLPGFGGTGCHRSPTPCITPTPEGWSTGTSSPPTS